MNWILGIALSLVVFCLMEAITWFTHRYIMHGFLWTLHRDHHQPSEGPFERNDLFAFIFAVPCIALFYFGSYSSYTWLTYIAIGILMYGVAYFVVHDIIIHQRVKWLSRSKNKYVRALRWAHKMHHKHTDADPGESFGFLWVEFKYWKKILKDDARHKS